MRLLRVLMAAAVVLTVAYFTFGDILFPAPTYDDLLRQCTATCKSTPGRLVKRDLPYSAKPASEQYDCHCND